MDSLCTNDSLHDVSNHEDKVALQVEKEPAKVKKLPKYMRSAPIRSITHPVDRNLAWCFIMSVVFVSLAIVTGFPLVVTLLLLLPVVVMVRHTCTACASCQEGSWCDDDHKFVSAVDTFWLHDSEFNFHISHCLFFADPGLTATALRHIVADRILDKTNDDGKRVFRRFTRKVVPVVGGFCWVEDEDFRIENHVFEDPKVVITKRQLKTYMMNLMSKGMSSDKPLWDIRILRNYDRGRETLLVVRVHQVISDGISLVKLFCNHLGDTSQYFRLKPRFGGASFPLNVFRAIVVGPLTFLTWLLFTRRDYNFLNRGQKFKGERVISWSKDVPYSQVYRIKQITRSTFNDVLMSAVSGSLRTYFKRQGISNPPDVKVCVPVDLRYEPNSLETNTELGTQFTTATVRLPCNTEGAIPCLWEVRQVMEDMKTSADPVVMYGASQFLLTLLPYRLAHWFLAVWQRKPSVVFSNVPGPEEMVCLGSHKVRRAVVWSGWSPDVPLVITAMSYGKSFHVAVSAERSVVPNPGEIVRGFSKQLEHLASLLARRRIPGEHRRRSSFTAERRDQEIIKPPLHEIQQKLHAVQEELHHVTQKLEAEKSNEYSHAVLGQRVEELKEEFSELLLELRRRKSLADGIVINAEDEDLDGELRRPRKRALSVSVRRSSLTSVMSTSRPLTAPTGSQQSPLFRSSLDSSTAILFEQQRALLAEPL